MADLIYKQAAIDAVSKADVLETYAELYDVFDDYKEIKKELHKVYDKLNALPSAQVEPVKQGRWEWIGGYGYQYRCSECVLCAERRTKYCPNCGAKMKEVHYE